MRCRACDGPTELIFEMSPMPLAGAFAATAEEAEDEPRYPLRWLRCRRCGLVNVEPDIPDATLYRHYAYAASTVPALVRHHAEFAAELVDRHRGSVRLLEIGCNDGVLLRQLPDDWDLVGVDPSDIANEATGPWGLLNEPFTMDVARQVGKFDVITSSNAFAHFTGIGEAIEGIAHCLAPDGTVYIEVHDLDATLASGQWDTVYHEHKVEWAIDSLNVAFARYGLRMTACENLPLHGGLLRARFRKSHPAIVEPVPPPDFELLRVAYATRKYTNAYHIMREGGAAYGAAARASVYLNQIPDLPLGYIVDGSPRRAGRYMPGTGLQIVTPEFFDADPPMRTLITAWNHAADIKARHPGYERWVTAW